MSSKNIFKDYFSFTKKERYGVFILLAIILFVFIMPYFFPSKKKQPNKEDLEQFKKEIAQLEQLSNNNRNPSTTKEESKSNDNFDFFEPKKQREISGGPLFYFDPNIATEGDWQRLGLRDKTIRTIQNYLSKGGKFKKPEDLKRIYGLGENEFQRLNPYIKINSEQPSKQESHGSEVSPVYQPTYKPKEIVPIDINDADTAAFDALPGIGNRLAYRIINFRDKLGGFYSVEQLGETYNLPDSTFQKIKPFLKLGEIGLKKININQADAAALKAHPYINWNLANAIVQYRNQHGKYKSVEELKGIAIMSDEIYRKISPYLEN